MRLASFCSHGGTVLSLILTVFLGINTVNEAMAFYEHPYTKFLLLLLCLFTAVNTLLLSGGGRRRPLLLPLPLACAAAQLVLVICALAQEDLPLYVGVWGQGLAFLHCLICLILSLWLGFSEKRGD